jgi:hypothetical protein
VQNDPQLRITQLSVHRLLVTAVLVAAKFLDDSYFNNAYYSKARRHRAAPAPGLLRHRETLLRSAAAEMAAATTRAWSHTTMPLRMLRFRKAHAPLRPWLTRAALSITRAGWRHQLGRDQRAGS